MTHWTFEVGKQVVCVVDFTPLFTKHFPAHFVYPVLKGIYTIRLVGMQNDWGSKKESLSIGLEGIFNIMNGTDCLFHASTFRPVKDTSIECFTKLLKPIKELTL